jgi:protein SMG6
MEVDGDERRRSSDLEAVHAQSPSAIQVSPVLSDAAASLELPPAFKMAQELTFTMLAHALRSKRDTPNSYVTIILTFLQTVLQHSQGVAALERAIPWSDLATFVRRGPRVSSSYMQSEKLSKSSIMSEDWAIRGMVWPGRLFERGFWDCGEDHLMEMEMLDARDSPSEASGEDGMWEDDFDDNDKPCRETPSRATLAWRRTMWACTKITKSVPGFEWDGKSKWWIDGVLAEKARQWEEEDRQAREEEERRKMGRRWIDLDGDQLMDVEDEIADTLSESGSDDDEGDTQEIKALKV